MAVFHVRHFGDLSSLDGVTLDSLPPDGISITAALSDDDWVFLIPSAPRVFAPAAAAVASVTASASGVAAVLATAVPPGPVLAGPIALGNAVTFDSSDEAVDGPQARGAYSVTGTGITIGILSDSFDVKGGEATAQQDGYLPAAINILKEGPMTGSDEGQAMAEIIHSIAPGATIDFYTAFDGESDFASGIAALKNAGAQIIVDDVYYLDEPFYQDAGPVTLAAQQAVADGVDYFAAAGNFGENDYEATFNAVDNVTLPGFPSAQTVHEVSSGQTTTPYIEVSIAAGSKVSFTLEWAQPYASSGGGNGAAYGLGVAFYDSNHNLLNVFDTTDPIGSDPVVDDTFDNTSSSGTVYMVFFEDAGTASPGQFKIIFADSGVVVTGPLFGGGSGTIFGHAEATGVNTVGAINVANTPSGSPEYFSSSGPGEILYNTAGALLATPIDPAAPDFLGPDGSDTSIYTPFDGTSAAAPAAAAVAALMLQADPALTTEQVTAILEQTATSDGGTSANIAGAGLINADAAVAAAAAIAACYLRGTRIATLDGERRIEDLRVGDRVVTLAGAARPIRWIGRRGYSRPFAGASVQPVRFAPGSLAPGLPSRALYVSPSHAMFLDGKLIAADCLANGTTIRQVEREHIEYLHIELDTHDVIFAEGAPSETFQDTGNRGMFENARECAGFERSAGTFAPRIEALSYAEVTNAADVHVRTGGVDFRPIQIDGHVYRFVIPARPSMRIIELRSGAAVPARLCLGHDSRRLGVAVHDITFRLGRSSVQVRPGDAAMLGGFHEPEPGLCWTDGQAHIRVPESLGLGPAWFGAAAELEITLRATTLPLYPAPGPSRPAEGRIKVCA